MKPKTQQQSSFHPKDFEKKRYLADLKVLAPLREEKTKQYAMLVFTILALSFFGLFAINPTIATIVELRKKLADSELANDRLAQKIAALSALSQQYNSLQPQLPAVFAAIPEDPQAVLLLGQIQAIAEKNNITVREIKSLPVALKRDPKQKKKKGEDNTSIEFTIEGSGTYSDVTLLLDELTQFDRIVQISQVTIAKEGRSTDSALEIVISGKAFFQK